MGLLDAIRSLFGGSPKAAATDPIETADRAIVAFWGWWASSQQELQESVSSGMTPQLIQTMSQRVEAIHPELGWEFSAGSTTTHALALSGGGNALLRLLAERWRAMGPGDDAVWAFHATKPPLAVDALATTELRVGPHTFAFADVRVSMEHDETRNLVDVSVWHPSFLDLPEEVRGQLTFISLDSALGEDAVERYLGAIDISVVAPADGVDLKSLRERVDRMASQERAGSWIIGEGPDAETGQPCVYALDRSVRRWDHPLCDTFVRVVLPYAENDGGMPADPEVVDVLVALEEDLVARLGDGVAQLGRRTGAGARILFLYIDGREDLVDRVRAWGAQCPRPCDVHVDRDPMWERRPG